MGRDISHGQAPILERGPEGGRTRDAVGLLVDIAIERAQKLRREQHDDKIAVCRQFGIFLQLYHTLYLFVCASDYPKTASHFFGPMLYLFVCASDYPKTASHFFGPMLYLFVCASDCPKTASHFFGPMLYLPKGACEARRTGVMSSSGSISMIRPKPNCPFGGGIWIVVDMRR